MEDTDFLIPDVIERIVRFSSAVDILQLGTLSKRWREVVHSRTLWRGFDRKKVYCLPRTLLPSAYIAAISSTWGQSQGIKINATNLAPNADPTDQLENLQYLQQLSQAYPVSVTFILDNNRHLISGDKKVQLASLGVIERLGNTAPLPCIRILVDFLMPHLAQFLVAFEFQRDELVLVLNILKLCFTHAAIRRQHLKEFFSRGLLKKVLKYITLRYANVSVVAAARGLLHQLLLDADQHPTEILPAVGWTTRLYINSEAYSEFLVLIRSTNAQIWKEIFTTLESLKNSSYYCRPSAATMALIHEALADLFQKDLQSFAQLSQWPGASDHIVASVKYLTKSVGYATMSELHQFIVEKLEKCEGWIRIMYIQSLIDNKLIKKIVDASNDDHSAFDIICFIVANSSADQDAILKQFDVLEAIGLRTRSKNSTESESARKIVELLCKKSVFAPLVLQQIKNKTIRI